MQLRTTELIGSAAGIAVLVALVGFGVTSITMLPPEAPVLIDQVTKTYATNECVQAGTAAEGFYLMIGDELATHRIEDARKGGMKPDPKCRAARGFEERRESMTWSLIRKVFNYFR